VSSFYTAAYVVRCDSCGTQHGLCAPYPSALETRAALQQQGWCFPTLTIGDRPTPVDLCPGCMAIFGSGKPDQ
jgi:hypothetical protein